MKFFMKHVIIAVYRPCGCEIHACVDNSDEAIGHFPFRCKFHIESTHQETGGYMTEGIINKD